MNKKSKLSYKIKLSKNEINLILNNISGLDSDLTEQLITRKNLKGFHPILFQKHMLNHILSQIRFLTFMAEETHMCRLISLANTLEGIKADIL